MTHNAHTILWRHARNEVDAYFNGRHSRGARWRVVAAGFWGFMVRGRGPKDKRTKTVRHSWSPFIWASAAHEIAQRGRYDSDLVEDPPSPAFFARIIQQAEGEADQCNTSWRDELSKMLAHIFVLSMSAKTGGAVRQNGSRVLPK